MKNKKLWMIILSVAPLLMVLAFYSKLPATVPVHWGIDGNVDRYGSKNELFLIAGMNILMGVMFFFLPKIDPKQKNYDRFQGIYEWMAIWTLAFMAVMTGLILRETMYPGSFDIGKVVVVMVAVLFICMGNVMPKVKQNFFTGVKTPWALSSETVWNKTHRLGGKCFVFGGILMLISAFLGNGKIMFGVTVGVALLIGGIPSVMSYIWYKNETKE